MIKYDLSLDYLRTFLAVASGGSMHRASEERHMTQPAVTRQMALLARGVGVRLFVRFGRGIRLTPAGETLLQEAREIFRRIEEGVSRVREVEGQTALHLSVGASHYVATNGLARPIREFVLTHREVRLSISFGSSEEMISKVLDGDLDLAVTTLPSWSSGSGNRGPGRLNRVRLWTDSFVAAIPGDHPLAGLPEVRLEEISRETLLLPPAGSTTRVLIDRAFRKRGIRPSLFVEQATLETIAAGVEMSLGIAILPGRLYERKEGIFGHTVLRSFRDFDLVRELGIVTRKGHRPGLPETELVRLLKDRLGER